MAKVFHTIKARVNYIGNNYPNVRKDIINDLVTEYRVDLISRIGGFSLMAEINALTKKAEEILNNKSTYDLLNISNGALLRNYIEQEVIDKIIARLREIGTPLFNEILNAEPSLNEDEYWGEYNQIYDEIYRFLGSECDGCGSWHLEDFNLIHILIDDVFFKSAIKGIMKELNELNEYFIIENEYQVTIKVIVKAETEEIAIKKVNDAIKNIK